MESEAFWDAVDALSDRLGPDATADDAIEAFISDRGLTGAVARRVRQELRAEVEAMRRTGQTTTRCAGSSLAKSSAADLFGDLPRNGYRSVIDALATDVKVRLNTEVVSVDVAADGIRAACADGSVETGSHAIVTVPLGVLKHGGIRFEPPLPTSTQRAVDALGFGRYEKIALCFESPFWRDDGVSHLIVFPPDEDEPAIWVFDLDAFGAGPVLCAHLFHTLTPYALDRPPRRPLTG